MWTCILQMQQWIFHAVVRPVAQGYVDGEVFRTSPLFTFSFLQTSAARWTLGSNILAVTDSGATFICKLHSIFMHEDGDGSTDMACYVQRFIPLSQLANDSHVLRSAHNDSVGARELVLDSKQLLLKRGALNWLKTSETVVETKAEFDQAPNDRYLCRFVQEDAKVRSLRCAYLCHCFLSHHQFAAGTFIVIQLMLSTLKTC